MSIQMKVSDKGLLELAEHEGIVPAPYYDSVGVLTYGVGHTKSAGGVDPADLPKGMPRNLDKAIDECLQLFREDIVKYEERVNRAINVPLTQYQFDALVSFDFNTGGIGRAALTKAINAKEPNASRHFYGWLRPPELRKRRTAEERLFVTGDYDANGDRIPVWKVDANGKLRGQLKTMSGAEILKRMHRYKGEPAAPSGNLASSIAAFFAALFGRKKT